jgi:hypothetical protein
LFAKRSSSTVLASRNLEKGKPAAAQRKAAAGKGERSTAAKRKAPLAGAKPKLLSHCFTKYVKVTFLRGASLHPLPPVESKHPNTRYFHIHEDDQLDEELVAGWIRRASELPGEPLF